MIEHFDYEGFFCERTMFHEREAGAAKADAEQLAFYESLVVFMHKNYPAIFAQFNASVFKPTLH